MSEAGHHGAAQPAEQHGEDLLPEPGQEEAQVSVCCPSADHHLPSRSASGTCTRENLLLMVEKDLHVCTEMG